MDKRKTLIKLLTGITFIVSLTSIAHTVYASEVSQETIDYVNKLPKSSQENFKNLRDKASQAIENAQGLVKDYVPYISEVSDIYYNRMASQLSVNGLDASNKAYIKGSKLLAAIDNYCSDVNTLDGILNQNNQEIYLEKFNEVNNYLMSNLNENRDIVKNFEQVLTSFKSADDSIDILIYELNEIAEYGDDTITLRKNSYVYIPNDKYAAFFPSKKLLKKGSTVHMFYSTVSNGRGFIEIAKNKYIPSVNVKGKSRKLKQNTYIMGMDGSKFKKVKKNKWLTTYGIPFVGLKDKIYYTVKGGHYVKKSAFIN